MKKNLVSAACAVLLFFAAPSYAAETKVLNHIPGRYALLVAIGVDPAKPLVKKDVLESATRRFKKLNVEQMHFAIYDKGKKPGDGPRAFGELRKGNEAEAWNFQEGGGEYAKAVEDFFGYTTTPKELYDAYSDNEVVADDDFKGKPVLLKIKVPQVAKDYFDKPYIRIGVNDFGMFGLRIYLNPKDPFLRKIKRGSEIVIRGYPKGFVMRSVVIDGVILSDGQSILLDGKAVPIKDRKGK